MLLQSKWSDELDKIGVKIIVAKVENKCVEK